MPATRRLPWQFYLAAILGLAVAVGLLFVAFTVAIFLLPVIIVIVLWQRWRWQQRIRAAMGQARTSAATRTPGGKPVIDADYVVVDEPTTKR